jgi:hypothetical protein
MEYFDLKPERYPQKIALDLSPAVVEWLQQAVRRTGRSEDELLLQLLDLGMKAG